MSLEHHELAQLFTSLKQPDKDILRALYRRDSEVPLNERKVTVQGVRRLGIYVDAGAAKRHLEMLEQRGFLRRNPEERAVWYPVLDETVRAVIVGPAQEVSA